MPGIHLNAASSVRACRASISARPIRRVVPTCSTSSRGSVTVTENVGMDWARASIGDRNQDDRAKQPAMTAIWRSGTASQYRESCAGVSIDSVDDAIDPKDDVMRENRGMRIVTTHVGSLPGPPGFDTDAPSQGGALRDA